MDADRIEHSLTLLAMLKELKRTRFICDVELKVGAEIVSAHKVVLAASSDYFVQYFYEHSSSHYGPIEVSGITPIALRICLDYMYEGVANLTVGVVEDVIKASKQLRIHGLTKMCVKFLMSALSIGNCLEVTNIVKKYELLALSNVAEKLAVQHCELVIQTDGFCNLKSAQVSDYLGKLLNPEQKWKAALLWMKNDFMYRKLDFPAHLKIILPNCTFEFLLEVVWSERPVMEIPQCSSLVASAIFQRVNPSKLALSNCFTLLEIARSHSSDCPDDKRQSLLDFVAANLDSAAKSDGFRNLVGDDLLRVLGSPNCRIFPAENIWRYVVVWAKCDLGCRLKFLRRIIKRINWKECSFQYFLNQVFNDFLVKYSKASSLAADIILKLMKPADITQTNWYVLLEITRKHDDVFSTDCLDKIMTFAAANFAQISITECFGKVSCKDLTRLLQRPEVRASCTDGVKWEAAINWVRRDVDSRKKCLFDILSCLDLRQWRFKFLYESVRKEMLVTESAECEVLVISVVFAVLTSSDISTSNCYELLRLTKQYSDDANSEGVISKIHQFFVEYYHEISELKFFVSLEWETIEYILNHKLFQHCPCELKWRSVCSWLRHDDDRKQYFSQVFQRLRLEYFPFGLLEKKVSCLSWVQDDEYCNDVCVSAMLKNLTYGDIDFVNWYNILITSANSKHSNAEVKEKIKQFMAANFTQISLTAHFPKLSLEEIIDLLNSPEITSASPEAQLRGVLRWYDESGGALESDLTAMIRALKLEGFPFSLLYDNIRNEEVIKTSQFCHELFLRGIQHALRPRDVQMENWFVLFQMAKDFGRETFQGIVHVVLNFVASNFQTLHHQDKFNNLEMEDLRFVLESRDFRCQEDVKASSVLQWVEHRESARWTYLPDLLGLVNLNKLDRGFIRHKIYDSPMVKTSDACREMLLQSLMEDDRQEVANSRPRKRDRNNVN